MALERYWFDNGHYHCRRMGAEEEKYEKSRASRATREKKHIIPTFLSLSLFDPMICFEAAVLWVEDLTIRQICVNIVLSSADGTSINRRGNRAPSRNAGVLALRKRRINQCTPCRAWRPIYHEVSLSICISTQS